MRHCPRRKNAALPRSLPHKYSETVSHLPLPFYRELQPHIITLCLFSPSSMSRGLFLSQTWSLCGWVHCDQCLRSTLRLLQLQYAQIQLQFLLLLAQERNLPCLLITRAVRVTINTSLAQKALLLSAQLNNECASLINQCQSIQPTIFVLDFCGDVRDFRGLFCHLDETYRDLDAVFAATMFAPLSVAHDVHMRE